MIELRGVSKRYHYNGQTIDAVKVSDFLVPKGRACCIYGQSGSGKSTLLHIVGGMLMPSAGQILINSTNLTTLPLHFLSSFRRDNIGFIFQQFNLLPQYTVLENIMLPLLPRGEELSLHKDRLLTLLDKLGIRQRADFPVSHLSGGEQQRTAVARALAADPAVIVADEPFSNLDPENSTLILEIFQEMKQAGKTFFLSATDRNGPEKDFIDQEVEVLPNTGAEHLC